MKKLICIIIFALSLCALLSSCDFDTPVEEETPHTHSFGEWETTEPTCLLTGAKTRSCACGEVESEELPAKGHTLNNYTVKGEKCSIIFVQECTVCDYEEQVDTGVVEHNYGEWALAENSNIVTSCGVDLVYSRRCADCGVTDSKVEYSDGHSFGSWNKVGNQTENCDCESPIVYVRICVSCFTADSKTEDAPGHSFTNWSAVNEPTERSEGLIRKRCRNCSCHDEEINLPVLSQENVDNGTYSLTETEKSCISDGEKVYGYTVEDKTLNFTVIIPSYGHEIVNDVCTVCGKTVVAGLYDAEDNLLITWDALINTYRLDFEKDYSILDCVQETNPGGVLKNNPDLSQGSRLVLGDIKKIGESAFYGCTSITHISIPEGVETIGNCGLAFYCGVTSIMIPSSVISIDSGCVEFCTTLVEIKVAENNRYYKAIDGNLYTINGDTLISYAGGKKEAEFVVPDGVTDFGIYAFSGTESLKSVVIPDDVTVIGSFAFSSGSMESLVIPNSVVEIEDYAFSGLGSIKNIYFTGTKEEWSKIKIGVNNQSIEGSTVHFNYISE